MMARLGVSLSVPLFSLGISKLVTKPKEYYMYYAAYQGFYVVETKM